MRKTSPRQSRTFQQSLNDGSFVCKAVKSALAIAKIRAARVNVETNLGIQHVICEGVIRHINLTAEWKLEFDIDVTLCDWGDDRNGLSVRNLRYDSPFYDVTALMPVVSTVGVSDKKQGLGSVQMQIIELNNAMYQHRRAEVSAGEDQALFNVAVSRMLSELTKQIGVEYGK